jgi:peptidoglycan hydrolase-like protein with peptidoglycan-binding domain
MVHTGASTADAFSGLDEPGWLGRLRCRAAENPVDTGMLLLALAAAIAITVNALALQDGRHPAPLLHGELTAPRAPLPEPASHRPQAVQAAAPAPAEASPPADGIAAAAVAGTTANPLVRDIQAELARRGLYTGTIDGIGGPKTDAAIRAFEGKDAEPTPALLARLRAAPKPVTPPSPRILAVQRVLSDQGFGPLKVDGAAGDATRAAIKRFEASRGLPQQGEITPALLKSLSAASGVRLP